MSKFLVQLALLQTKTLVNAYTWTTLPLYALTQKPWIRLKLSKSLGVQSYLDSHGRTVYHRPTPLKDFTHPYLSMYSFNELVPLLDRSRKIVGIRDVLSEIPQLDPETGKPIKIDGRELKKVELTKDYQWLTVGQVLDQADSIARGLGELGVKAGDKMIIYADNGLEWFCTATALQRMNATGVSLLSILNDEGIVYGINQCEARFAITSQDLLKKIDRNSDKINYPLNMVYIRDKFTPNDPKLNESIANLTAKGYKISSYDEVQEIGAKVPVYDFPIPNPGDVAYIMYTSGTTGNPKGVMLTHKNLFNGLHLMMRQDREMSAPLLNARYAAYLPMAHIFGLMMNFGLFVSDARIGLCSPMTMLDSSPAHVEGQVGDIKLIKPELIGGVPLVLDRILKEIYRKLHARSSIAEPIFTYLMDYKIRWKGRGFDTPILNRILCSKINEQFGGRLTTMMVGSAPLNERTQAMVQEILNVKMIQAYGSTEMTGASHMTTTDSLDYGHCGVPVAGSKFYLKDWPEGCYSASDKPNPRGEIVVGGNTIADGYYKMPEETDEAFKVDADGMRWFESGDIGELLPSGNLKIIDRKKDLTKLANGEYVSLGKIESGLRSSTFVENICICTDPYSNHVTALITPNRRALQEYSAAVGKHAPFEQLCDDPEVIEHVHHSLKHRGQGLGFSKKELPVVITLVKEEWTPDNNLLTAALKMRRKQVNDFYRKEIGQMFERNNEN